MKRYVRCLSNARARRQLLVAAGLASATTQLLAVVPTPPTPSTTPATSDAIAWVKGVFEDSSEVGILALGVILFILGAAGMIWAITQVMSNKATIGEVGKIGIASAAGIAFGTYALGQATAII